MTIFQADAFRIVVSLAAGWSLLMTLAILWAFTSRVGWGIGWRSTEGRKRLHIMLVSLAFVILSMYAITEMYQRIGTHLTWRGYPLMAAFLISGFGQYSMLTAQIADRRRGPVTVEPVIDPVLVIIERVALALERIEERQESSADRMTRMEETARDLAIKAEKARRLTAEVAANLVVAQEAVDAVASDLKVSQKAVDGVASDLKVSKVAVDGVADDLRVSKKVVEGVADDLKAQRARADAAPVGEPGSAADAGLKSDPNGGEQDA